MSSSILTPQKCESCRISDSECDLQRPKCSTCTAKSIACTYPETPVNFTFVDQNDAAATASRRAARRRRRHDNRRTMIPLDASLLEIGRDALTRQEQSAQFAPPILYTLDNRVIQRFISRWAAGQTALGCLDSMPELFETSGRDSAMQRAILATAYADLAAFERHGDRGTKCYQEYSRSLQRLQDELSKPNFVASDSILAAVLAIDAFELLYMGRTDPLGFHTQAILRFLQLRKDHIADNTQSFTLWRSAHQRIFARQLFCGIPSLASLDLVDSTGEDEDRPEVRTIKFVADTCDVMSQLETERNRPSEEVSRNEILHLSAKLRMLLNEAHEWSERRVNVPKPRRVRLDLEAAPELKKVFPRLTIIVYDNFWIARDRLLFCICSVKILDMLMDLRTQEFTSIQSGYLDVDATRDFLLATQPDLAALQTMCRFALGVVPLLIGIVDSNGTPRVNPWTLNDTGVLTVKSPLNAMTRLKYVLPEIKTEANAVVNFLHANRHIILQH